MSEKSTNQKSFSSAELEEAKVTAYALGQLEGDELTDFEAELRTNGDLQRQVQQLQQVAAVVATQRSTTVASPNAGAPASSAPTRQAELRAAVERHLDERGARAMSSYRTAPARRRDASQDTSHAIWWTVAAALLLAAIIPLVWFASQFRAPEVARLDGPGRIGTRQSEAPSDGPLKNQVSGENRDVLEQNQANDFAETPPQVEQRTEQLAKRVSEQEAVSEPMAGNGAAGGMGAAAGGMGGGGMAGGMGMPGGVSGGADDGRAMMGAMGEPDGERRRMLGRSQAGGAENTSQMQRSAGASYGYGGERPAVESGAYPGKAPAAGMGMEIPAQQAAQVQAGRQPLAESQRHAVPAALGDRLATVPEGKQAASPPAVTGFERLARIRVEGRLGERLEEQPAESEREVANEQYEAIVENPFLSAMQSPLSTFSIDVDTASYANVRRFLRSHMLPPPAAVRIEEMVNYFRYDYAGPEGDEPFAAHIEAAQCPWQPEHRLVRVALKGKEIDPAERPASNLVFLLDVSGSMNQPDKLPLLQQAMLMLTGELTENDRVSIVTYAGNAGLRLPSTTGDQQQTIRNSIESLRAGGSTNGSGGIVLAYDQAVQNFIEGGTNRVILATDGDLNVGITEDAQLVDLITEKARSGVFLTVLGFGTGNLKDAKLEKLADNGNGMYAYVDNQREAKKVLVEQIAGSLVTIAKDVKVQIEFNPRQVESYRLIGYENRMLAARDFDDDSKDAGEIGAGHTVTALYEVVPRKQQELVGAADPIAADESEADGELQELKYQRRPPKVVELTEAAESDELLTLKLRYKQPDADTSQLLQMPLKDSAQAFNKASSDFQFAASVAAFGMLLRGSQYSGDATIAAVEEIASGALGEDPGGYREEFLELVRTVAADGWRRHTP